MKAKIVGISFNPTDNPKIAVTTPVSLIHDKDNKFSSRAIAVMFGEQLLGHIGEKNNEFHEEIFNALPIEAEVCRVARLAEDEKFGKFETNQITSLEIEFPMASDKEDGIQSFNEPDVTVIFDPTEHKYTHDGKVLIGCSTYVKRWFKEFDTENISGAVANSLGVKQSEVLAVWENGGKISADFGTVIHNAFEHYEKYKEIGGIMQEKKDLPYNKALPSHPVLRDIVLDFLQRFTHKEDEVAVEAIVTNIERGLSGTIDRLLILDSENKICRVQDYKINIDCEVEDNRKKFLGQMAPLPPNKLSEYQIKMSFYARLLELAGWKVEGLDAFVYDGEWKKYSMEVLSLDF